MATSIDPVTGIPKTSPAGLTAIDASTSPGVNSLERTKGSGSAAEKAGLKLADDFNSFLQLLTTQLQHQDPTEPMDTNQFTQQLVAFSGVEQSVAMNKNLEALINLNQGSQVSNAVNYIGKIVDTQGNQVALQSGKAVFSVDVPLGAASVTVGIVDSAGKPIYSSTTQNVPAGMQDFGWDGQNSFGGAKAPDGVYSYGVVARDAAGKVLETKTYSSGQVVSVSQQDGKAILEISGGLEVPLEKVLSVRVAPVPVVASNSGNTEQATN